MIRRPSRSTRLTHSFPTRRSSDLMPRTESCWTLWTFKGHRISKVWFKCHLARVARKQGQRMKRLIDIAGSLFGLLLLSPVMLVAAIAIHRHMGEPVLFVPDRPGLRGRPFRMYKFRTLRNERKSVV